MEIALATQTVTALARMLRPFLWLRRKLSGEKGSSSVSFAVAAPAIVALMMLIVQAGLWAYATQVAHYAATTALDTARADGGSVAVARTQANAILRTTTPNLLTKPQVRIYRDGTRVTVAIKAEVQPLLPGMVIPVAVTSSAELERFTTDQDR
ncbi:hypothetical protein GCM10009765_23890 [Fodinicola feengrottensis]|uniref:TadE-like domain-containing protein n=2 Tax=Fodinicola feengrottensis TaxID=435914 RepID=A0ABP4SLQ4_9ACTN